MVGPNDAFARPVLRPHSLPQPSILHISLVGDMFSVSAWASSEPMDVHLIDPIQLTAFLRAMRRQRGWTQKELGQRLGLGQARIAEIEKRPELISVKQLLEIVSLLGGRLYGRPGRLVELAGTGTASATGVVGEPRVESRPPPDPAPKGEW